MPYKQTPTACVVHLARLHHLPATIFAQCQGLRQEAGRLWTDLVQMHTAAHTQGQWLQAGNLEKATKGGQYGVYGKVQSDIVKYRRPIVVVPATRAEVAGASQNLPASAGGSVSCRIGLESV